MNNNKYIIHANRWDIFINKNRLLIKGGYSVKVAGYNVKKFVWEVVDDNVVEKAKDNDEIGLQGFYSNILEKRGGWGG